MFPPDLDVTLPTQELFEQFYEAHGLPNDGEKLILRRAGEVTIDVLDAWCECALRSPRTRTESTVVAAKEQRMRACKALRERIKKCLYLSPSFVAAVEAHEASQRTVKKPYTRH